MGGTIDGLVSVIIPAFNVADYIERCVESVLNQTYRNLDIILVNDGSTDGSSAICDAIARRDGRVRVIHQPNGGLSDARNTALDLAGGDYVMCIDGDDFVALDHVEHLMSMMHLPTIDIATCKFRRVLPHVKLEEASGRLTSTQAVILNAQEALENLFYQRGVTTSAWGKLYRRPLFNGIRYERGALHEDLPVTYQLFARARAVAISPAVTYFYVARPESITQLRDIARRRQAITFAENAVSFVEETLPALIDAARTRLFMEAVYITAQSHSVNQVRTTAPEAEDLIRSLGMGVFRNPNALILGRLYGAAAVVGGIVGVRILGRLVIRGSALVLRLRDGSAL